jgi:hypothetical protein
MLRTLRVRSQENAEYTQSYNRMRFIISPDGMSTDLSQSYLAFKLYVVNGRTRQPYTDEEIKTLCFSNIMFSFSDSVGEAYSPACLIKTARLFYKGQPLEEIQYSNVLSQTLKQFQSDFETLASESIMSMNNTGMLLNGSLATSTSSYFGAPQSLTDPAVQVNIPLKDLFGVCKSNNFLIDSDVLIELELEDSKQLIQQSCVVDLSAPLPNEVNITPTTSNVFVTGFTSTVATNKFANLCPTQNLFSESSREMVSLFNKTSKVISTPQSYRFGSDYFDNLFTGAITQVPTNTLTVNTYYRITILGALTLAEWTTAGWRGSALPVLGDYFKCLAVTVAGGSCIAVNADNKIPAVPGTVTNKINITTSLPWTTANLNELELKAGALLKLVFRLTQPNHVDRFFEFMSLIQSVTAFNAGAGATIVFNDSFAYPIYTGDLVGTVVSLDAFELIPNSEQFTLTQEQYEELISDNKITGLTEAQVQKLQIAGVLSGGTLAEVGAGIRHLTGGNVMFNCGISINSTAAVDPAVNALISIYPDVYDSPDVPSLRRLYSSQTKKLPTQQGLLRVVKATKNVANPTTQWDLLFHTAGLENNNSLQSQNLQVPVSGAGAIIAGPAVKTTMLSAYLNVFNSKIPKGLISAKTMVVGEWYGISNVGSVGTGSIDTLWNNCGNPAAAAVAGQSFYCTAPMVDNAEDTTVIWLQPNRSHAEYKGKTWMISKAEVVLVQHERDPDMPPAPIYSTFRTEAFTIENKLLTDYQRQFIVSEKNCFNLIVATPNYTADSEDLYPESLISKSHNINQYRFAVNNIDDTNRPILIKNNTSSAPSTLHLDKLMDTFKNNMGGLMSMSGINGVWRSVDAPVCFPLKIYTAMDAEMNYLSGLNGYTIQWSAVGDSTHNMYIQPGACFLFKQCFKTLP